MVWAGEGKKAATLEAFFDELGEERAGTIEAGSLDMGGAYAKAAAKRAPRPVSASIRST